MNILLTSAGRRTYLINYFKEAIGNDGKVFASNSVMTYTLQQADGYVVSPKIYDENYINFLIHYCKKNDITVIISLFDIDLPVLSASKERFKENGITVIVSDLDVITLCNDKWKTYTFLKENNILTPKTFICIDDALKSIKAGEIQYPVIIKPRWGMGSLGIYKIDNEEELIIFYKKLKRQIFETYLKYESKEDSDNCILIQECINGEEFGLDILNNLEGNYITTISKQKLAMRAGETDIATIVDNSPFETIGKTLSTGLRHIANLDVDCFRTSNGNIYVLELNCRFGGQYPFSHMAGVNFPLQIIRWIKGMPSDPELFTPKVGTTTCKDLLPVIFNN